MLLHKILYIIIILFTITACGFTPIHSQKHGNNPELFAAVKINDINSNNGSRLKYTLEDMLNPYGTEIKPKYNLTILLKIANVALDIQHDSTVTRRKIKLSAKYELTSIDSKKILESDTISREGEYDKVESDYATHVSEKDTITRIINELAEDLRLQITTLIVIDNQQNEDSH